MPYQTKKVTELFFEYLENIKLENMLSKLTMPPKTYNVSKAGTSKIESKNDDEDKNKTELASKINKDKAAKIAMPLIKSLSQANNKQLKEELQKTDNCNEENTGYKKFLSNTINTKKILKQEENFEKVRESLLKNQKALSASDLYELENLDKKNFQKKDEEKKIKIIQFLKILLGITTNEKSIDIQKAIDLNPDLKKFLEQNNLNIQEIKKNAIAIEHEIEKQIKLNIKEEKSNKSRSDGSISGVFSFFEKSIKMFEIKGLNELFKHIDDAQGNKFQNSISRNNKDEKGRY